MSVFHDEPYPGFFEEVKKEIDWGSSPFLVGGFSTSYQGISPIFQETIETNGNGEDVTTEKNGKGYTLDEASAKFLETFNQMNPTHLQKCIGELEAKISEMEFDVSIEKEVSRMAYEIMVEIDEEVLNEPGREFDILDSFDRAMKVVK